MNGNSANAKMVTKLLFRLLPVQILLAMVGFVNGIVSSFFASNYVGVEAMGAVGLYSPINMLLQAVSTMLVGGSVILCGKYTGKNEPDKLRNNFSVNLIVTAGIAAFFILVMLVLGLCDFTGFFTTDPLVRPYFNSYLVGQSIGVFPLLIGNLLTAFLSMENKGRRTIVASLVYIAFNVVANFLFVQVLRMETFGLALASALGLWVFLAIQAGHFLKNSAQYRVRGSKLSFGECKDIIKIGFPGAASNGYQTIRGLIVNLLLTAFVGSVGISAFAAADNLLRIFWAVPTGMLAVSRMLISVSVGEEDRRTLTDIMRVMFSRFVPLMCGICALIIICAVPLTKVFYHDPSEPVFMMTVWGLRILPLCMPLSIILMHFVCYGQASGKQFLVHALSLLDGVVCVAGFTALLIRSAGMNSVYIANVLNGVVTTLVIIAYAWFKNRRFPRNMDELMVIPDSFGAPEADRMDLSVRDIGEVVKVAEAVQNFCLGKGIDGKRAYLAGLSMEEMAGNIVAHGFTKDSKKHSIDIRVVMKADDLILRIKDDCVPFDPASRKKLADNEDITKNIGIRLVFKISKDVRYSNILGMNVLTIRI